MDDTPQQLTTNSSEEGQRQQIEVLKTRRFNNVSIIIVIIILGFVGSAATIAHLLGTTKNPSNHFPNPDIPSPSPITSPSTSAGKEKDICAKAVGPFSVNGTKVLQTNGRTFIPYGITISGETSPEYATTRMSSKIDAQIEAAANGWCSNTVRIQMEQDLLVGLNGNSYNMSYMNSIKRVVDKAEKLGMVVVINDSTGPYSSLAAYTSKREPMPTANTEKFWHDIDVVYAKDPQVIYDLFNEPHTDSSKSVSTDESTAWNLWQNGGEYRNHSYIGMQALADYVRNDGSLNIFWIEGINYSATLDYVVSKTNGIKGDEPIVYAIHHPSSGQPHDATSWDPEFGNLIKDNIAPVVEGEWSNWADASATNLMCWVDAPTTVPNYLSYLSNLGIGMTVWTLAEGVMNATTGDYINPTHFYKNWSCTTPGLDQGAGQLVQDWFYKQNSSTGPTWNIIDHPN